MPLVTHAAQKYQSSELIGRASEWESVRVEHRRIGPGVQNCVRPECTELVLILSGKSVVRRCADGKMQEGLALPGTAWLVPAGTDETHLELDGATECLILFLPARLLEESALIDHGLDPSRAHLAYVGGFADPLLSRVGEALHGLKGSDAGPTESLVAEGLRAALTAHLVGRYTVDRWRPAEPPPALDKRRLRRVLDRIEACIGEPLSLAELAGEACLSPFHFSRLFRQATGLSPHRYVVERGIEAARRMIAAGNASMSEIALETGFGSQANFSRTFSRLAGCTPGEYRRLHRR
ncbi:MAG TPA: AraC family transcriptional regulator [Kaistia sp.]|nr:AraC family transcriptional regulator [Kaistia sp.]